MKLKVENNLITVKLSKRNLLALLHKVDSPDSAKTLFKQTDDDYRLILIAEPDSLHYQDNEPAGKMHPSTEEFIKFHSMVH